jgi:hypothetical protein
VGDPSRESRCYRSCIERQQLQLIAPAAALSDALNECRVLRLAIVAFAEVGAIRLLTQSLEPEKNTCPPGLKLSIPGL